MHNISSKKLSLHIYQYSGLELTLKTALIIFSHRHSESDDFSFTHRFYGRIGTGLRFTINPTNDLITFYCNWMQGKIAEIRIIDDHPSEPNKPIASD